MSDPAAEVMDPTESPGWWDRLTPGAAVLFAVLVVATYLHPPLSGDDGNAALRDFDLWWLAGSVAVAASLAVRRLYPVAVAVFSTVIVTLLAVAPYDIDPTAWAMYVVVFALGRHSRMVPSVFGYGFFLASIPVVMISAQDFPVTGLLFVLAFTALGWVWGREVRRWRDQADLEKDRAEQRVQIERQATQLAVTKERLHIAQELHDVMAHSMGVIAVQAGVAEAAFEARPETAREAVSSILETSRTSLNEIRRILGILRATDGEGLGYDPAPGIGDIPRLVESVEANGLPVEYVGPVRAERVPPGVQLSIYRIAQEALTNIMEHAAASRATVELECAGEIASLVVTDDGQGWGAVGSSNGGGFGLVGMRERVSAFKGELEAGPMPEGGFRVAARIPFGDPLSEAGAS